VENVGPEADGRRLLALFVSLLVRATRTNLHGCWRRGRRQPSWRSTSTRIGTWTSSAASSTPSSRYAVFYAFCTPFVRLLNALCTPCFAPDVTPFTPFYASFYTFLSLILRLFTPGCTPYLSLTLHLYCALLYALFATSSAASSTPSSRSMGTLGGAPCHASPLHARYTPVTRPLHSRYTPATRPLHARYTPATRPLHARYTPVTRQFTPILRPFGRIFLRAPYADSAICLRVSSAYVCVRACAVCLVHSACTHIRSIRALSFERADGDRNAELSNANKSLRRRSHDNCPHSCLVLWACARTVACALCSV
jgi:hypothetical protein